MVQAAAVTLWLLVVLLPGIALLRLSSTGIPLGTSITIAAPISLGFTYLVGLVADRVGLPLVKTCVICVAAVTVAGLAVELRRARRAHIRQVFGAWLQSWRGVEVAVGRALLVTAIVLGGLLWRGLHSRLTVPSAWDAMHDGYFVRQIVAHGTLSASVVQSSDPTRADGWSFYPLAVHLVAAMLHNLLGLRISTLLLATTTAFGAVVLPLGTYRLVRWLAPAEPLLAGIAAVTAVLPAGLYTIDDYGKITTVVGMALIPAVATQLLMISDRMLRRLGPLCVLGVFGLLEAHTSEAPVCALLVVSVVLAKGRGGAWRRRVGRLTSAAAVGISAVVLLLLADPGAKHMLGQRGAYFGIFYPESLGASLRYFLVGPSPVPAHQTIPMAARISLVLALLGCVATLHRRWRAMRPIALTYVAFLAFAVLWSAGHLGPLRVLADPWYQARNRMLWELFVLGTIPAAVAIYAVATATVVLLPRHMSRPTRSRVAPRPVFATVLLAGAAWLMLPPVASMSAWARTNENPVRSSSLAAYRFLSQHVSRNARVLDDLDLHGDMWMYIDYGVPTLFGNPPPVGGAPGSWKQRLYLRAELPHIRSNGCVENLLRRYDVRYIYYSDRRFLDNMPRFTRRTLDNRRYFREVFRRGSVRVYRVVAPKTTLPCHVDTDGIFNWDTIADAR